MKQIQIPEELFYDLVDYFLSSEYKGEEFLADEIKKGLEDKLDKIINRMLFTKYKRTPTGAEREQARKAYLDRRGILDDYRTDEEYNPLLPNNK